MTVKITIEHSQYRLVADLVAINKKGQLVDKRPVDKLREKGMSRNEAMTRTLLYACRTLNQQTKMNIIIHTSSTYLKMCLQSLDKWQQSDWITSKGKTVTYRELWQEIYELTKNFAVEVTDG